MKTNETLEMFINADEPLALPDYVTINNEEFPNPENYTEEERAEIGESLFKARQYWVTIDEANLERLRCWCEEHNCDLL